MSWVGDCAAESLVRCTCSCTVHRVNDSVTRQHDHPLVRRQRAPETASAGQDETDDLIALFHRLQALSVRLAGAPMSSDEVVTELLDLLDGVPPVMHALNRVAPGVLGILSKLDEVHNVPMLATELTEAHRLLGHGLRDHGIDPGLPAMPVGELLRRSLLPDDSGNGKPLPIAAWPAQAG